MFDYKYNVGNYVKFKSKFTNPTCGLVWRAGTVAKITGLAKAYNNKPHYYVNGVEDEVFPESVFAGLATESEFLTQSPEYIEVDTSESPETKCDTGDSRESGNKTMWIVYQEEDGIAYECNNCYWCALNDYRGRSTASRFCPRCGKYMINHEMED
jgi:predicted RNA-binding Zn-ribbon protein involved in translation (DUF1610 family)